MRRIGLRALIIGVAFLALVLALIVQHERFTARERELRLRLEATILQMNEERDRYQQLLENAVITVPPGPAP